jgi:putative FmdB family regulatory protein
MPIYEYRCSQCGAPHEAIVLVGESEPQACPACGGPLKRKIPSSVGITFNGPGFFVTDNRKKKNEASDEKATEKSKTKE